MAEDFGEKKTPTPSFHVEALLTLPDMVRAAGLEWDEEILDAMSFNAFSDAPEEGRTLAFEVVRLLEEKTSEEVVAMLQEKGLRAAGAKELASYAKDRDDLGGTLGIVGLGGPIASRGRYKVPTLSGQGETRAISLADNRTKDMTEKWPVGTTFLGIRA